MLLEIDLSILAEKARKEILKATDPSFIHHAQYTKELPKLNMSGVQYVSSGAVNVGRFKDYQVVFNTNSASFPGERAYNQKVVLLELRALIRNKKLKKTLREKVTQAINGDLLIGCQCDAYLYYGYKYINTELGTAHPEFKELRPPVERNPLERGIICKHLDLALRVLPFNISQITRDLRKTLPKSLLKYN